MKRPEETNYPTTQKEFERSKQAIESSIDNGKFTVETKSIKVTSELESWLSEWGWKIIYIEGDFRDHEPGYYQLLPLII